MNIRFIIPAILVAALSACETPQVAQTQLEKLRAVNAIEVGDTEADLIKAGGQPDRKSSTIVPGDKSYFYEGTAPNGTTLIYVFIIRDGKVFKAQTYGQDPE